MRTEGEWKAYCMGSEGYQIRRNNDGVPAAKVKEELKERLTPIVLAMGGSFQTQAANAQFICKAVNSFDSLVEACEDVLNILNGMVPASQDGDKEVARSMLMAALKEAE